MAVRLYHVDKTSRWYCGM